MNHPRKPTAEVHRRHNVYQQQRRRAESRLGRDIGRLPPVRNRRRRERAATSYEFFCREYFPETFSLPWSDDHRRAIELIELSTLKGGQFAFAMPRGSGKTSLAERSPIWATFYGYKKFPMLVGSELSSAMEMMTTIKNELTENPLLLADFPEVVFPLRCLENISHRATGQLYKGESTKILWTSNRIILPTMPGSKASGAILGATGLTGRLRGMKFKRPDGINVRPDHLIIDDAQTDESARSPSQCETRLRLIRCAVLGLAGPGKRISAIMPCTVIAPGDLSDQLLDRKAHPEWRGERTKMVYDFPARSDLWDEYRTLRAAHLHSGDEKPANNFYLEHRAEMDKGARIGWAERFNRDEVSAIQHAMNLRHDLGDEAFMAEYQNEPLPIIPEDSEALTVGDISGKLTGRGRGVVPLAVTRLTAFIDVQKEVLYWAVIGFDERFGGSIIDYGTWPDQNRTYFTLADIRQTLQRKTGHSGLEAALRAGLDALSWQLLSRDFAREDGTNLRIERCPVDAGWQSDLVYEFCRASPFAGILIPSHGRYVGAKKTPFTFYRRQPGDRIGLNWRLPAVQKPGSVRYLLFDANWWKSFVMSRWRTATGGPGCLALFGQPENHQLFAEHICSEIGKRVTAEGRTVIEWESKSGRPDNHYLDCIVGAHVAASVLGVALAEQTAARVPRKRVRLSELQKLKHHAPR